MSLRYLLFSVGFSAFTLFLICDSLAFGIPAVSLIPVVVFKPYIAGVFRKSRFLAFAFLLVTLVPIYVVSFVPAIILLDYYQNGVRNRSTEKMVFGFYSPVVWATRQMDIFGSYLGSYLVEWGQILPTPKQQAETQVRLRREAFERSKSRSVSPLNLHKERVNQEPIESKSVHNLGTNQDASLGRIAASRNARSITPGDPARTPLSTRSSASSKTTNSSPLHSDSVTLLFWAYFADDLACFRLRLEQGADLDVRCGDAFRDRRFRHACSGSNGTGASISDKRYSNTVFDRAVPR